MHGGKVACHPSLAAAASAALLTLLFPLLAVSPSACPQEPELDLPAPPTAEAGKAEEPAALRS